MMDLLRQKRRRKRRAEKAREQQRNIVAPMVFLSQFYPPRAPFAPPDIASLSLWLAADSLGLSDGDPVNSWPDISGKGLHISTPSSESRPIFKANQVNGLPIVRFADMYDILQRPDVIGSQLITADESTIFCVYKHAADTNCWPFTWQGSNNNRFVLVGSFGHRVYYQQDFTLSFPGSTSATRPPSWFDGFHLLDASRNGSEVEMASDAARLQMGHATFGGVLDPTQSGTILLGSNPLAVASSDIAELLVYSRALTAGEKYALRVYLMDKYNLRRPNFVICEGDSLTAGVGAADGSGYPWQMAAALGPSFQVASEATQGKTLAEMIAQAPSQLDRNFDPTRSLNAVVMRGGIIDLISGATLATLKANYQAYCAARRNARWKVIASTLLPCGSEFEDDRQAFNTWLQANYASFADALADVADDARIGDAGDEADTTYYAEDGIHMNATGYGVVAEIVQAAVESL